VEVGVKQGEVNRRSFHLMRCEACFYSFVADPWTDFAEIYSRDYYHGRGADPSVDYVFELENPSSTVRIYEWQGILKAVKSLIHINEDTRWLDFGCGNGGLVRHCLDKAGCQAVGFEEGWIAPVAREKGIPIMNEQELVSAEGQFDVVTAIEVLEHSTTPLETLRRIRRMLRPGGLFLYTTGNAERYRRNLLKWSYFVPEMHVGLFEPRTLETALKLTGFRPEFKSLLPGYTDIIRFKVLKNLGVRERAVWEQLVPWQIVSRLVDWRAGITAHPIGWAEGAEERPEPASAAPTKATP
jgi:SAM-dependent methyltransferase